MQWYNQYKLVLKQYTYTCSHWVIWSAVPTDAGQHTSWKRLWKNLCSFHSLVKSYVP